MINCYLRKVKHTLMAALSFINVLDIPFSYKDEMNIFIYQIKLCLLCQFRPVFFSLVLN